MKKMDTLKIGKPCVDCIAEGHDGLWPPECMDFDHRDPAQKSGYIRQFLYKPDLLVIELAKCDLVCANHHRIRSRRRGVSESTRQKMKQNHVGMTGKRHSEATRAKLRGKRHTPESIAKMLATRAERRAQKCS